jgi:hypothetical protein
MDMKIGEGMSKIVTDVATKGGGSSHGAGAGGLDLGHQAKSQDIATFQSAMGQGPGGVAQLGQAAGPGGPEGAQKAAANMLTNMQKQVDQPHQQLHQQLMELTQKKEISAADMAIVNAKVMELGIVTQTQMNVVKKTNQNMQTFLKNQG